MLDLRAPRFADFISQNRINPPGYAEKWHLVRPGGFVQCITCCKINPSTKIIKLSPRADLLQLMIKIAGSLGVVGIECQDFPKTIDGLLMLFPGLVTYLPGLLK